MDIKEAARRLGRSVITIRRAIKENKLKASLEGGKYSIPEDALNEYALSTQEIALTTQSDQEMKHLQKENNRLDHEINQLRSQLSEREQQIEYFKERLERLEQLLAMEKRQNQQLLEYQLQPFWRRWFKHKALPAPENVMDMKPDTEKKVASERNPTGNN